MIQVGITAEEKIKACKHNISSVRLLASLFVVHCLQAKLGDKSHTNVWTEMERKVYSSSPPLLGTHSFTMLHVHCVRITGGMEEEISSHLR